ncbi:hypothetical protein EVAR_21741_1 [Eumeta japonica]|uniref:Uncharacterized protein n=1 Tax=Eumeta variegata TaxID=151549 RepID=A0A4C1ZMU2_EUMVA|nr:hypothetical protein EVAR_21741_1 [Eumeta japonica]
MWLWEISGSGLSRECVRSLKCMSSVAGVGAGTDDCDSEPAEPSDILLALPPIASFVTHSLVKLCAALATIRISKSITAIVFQLGLHCEKKSCTLSKGHYSNSRIYASWISWRSYGNAIGRLTAATRGRFLIDEVVEIRDSGGGFIHGKVTPQTRVNNRPYDVKVEEHLIDCNATYTFNDVQNVPYCTEGSLFGQYIQSEKDIEPLREIAREEEEKGKKKLDDLKCDFENTCPPELQSKYEEKIVADRSECLSISVLSESQSDCFEWFEERAKRVTCSSKAHRIKQGETHSNLWHHNLKE